MKHWPSHQIFPDKEWYVSRGVKLPSARFTIGAKLKTPIGTAMVEKLLDFPFCQYDCLLSDGEYKGNRVKIEFEWAELAEIQ